MSRYRRSNTAGGTYFFTVVTHHRKPLLLEPEVRRALREAITLVRSRYPFVIHAWVLMPDHLHCIWQLPPGDAAFGLRWGLIKRHTARACAGLIDDGREASPSRRHRHESGLWQRRFWEHQIRDDEDFDGHFDYTHWNPVRHGVVREIMDWPYSTFHRYVKAGVYSRDWGGQFVAGNDDANFGE